MIVINHRKISCSNAPFVIAELSANHCGNIDKAKKLIKKAKESGADAIKIQTYTADSMTLNCDKEDFLISEGTWKGYKLYDLYTEACTPFEWHYHLFDYARKLGITIFSSPFDENAIDFLEELNSPAYKIASFEIVDLPLIKYAASKGKPLLISTGMASESEINDAIKVAKDFGNGEILLFHCISSYPAKTSESNIRMIKTLKEKYNVEVGLSDHTLSNTAAIAAIALGASAIEKHFILDKKDVGPDSSFSINPNQLKKLIDETFDCWESLGCDDFKRSSSEEKNIIFRRSLYFVRDMNPGQIITNKDVKRIRPGYGLKPKYLEKILNKRVKTSVEKGDRVSWENIE